MILYITLGDMTIGCSFVNSGPGACIFSVYFDAQDRTLFLCLRASMYIRSTKVRPMCEDGLYDFNSNHPLYVN